MPGTRFSYYEQNLMGWSEMDARNRALAAAHAALAENGILVPVELGTDDERAWADCDLASLVENRLGEPSDPDELDRQRRRRWLATAVDAGEPVAMPRQRSSEACYWIQNDGRSAGTLALARYCLGAFVSVHSVYLRPRHRGKGIMANTLRAVHAELEARGIGMTLETSWTWQRAVRYYLGTGFWLRSWKRNLALIRPPRTLSPVFTIADTEATVAVDVRGHRTVLARARRDGGSLLEHGEAPELSDEVQHLAHHALTTLALTIALEGWPLIRSLHHWERFRTWDLLHPEALAARIQVWEHGQPRMDGEYLRLGSRTSTIRAGRNSKRPGDGVPLPDS